MLQREGKIYKLKSEPFLETFKSKWQVSLNTNAISFIKQCSTVSCCTSQTTAMISGEHREQQNVLCSVSLKPLNIFSLLLLPDSKRRSSAWVLPCVRLHSWSAQLQHQRNQEAPEGSCRQVTHCGKGFLSTEELLFLCYLIAAFTVTGWVLHTYKLEMADILFQAPVLSAGQNHICIKVTTHIQGPIKRTYQWRSSTPRLEQNGSPSFINRSQQRRKMVHLLMCCGIT